MLQTIDIGRGSISKLIKYISCTKQKIFIVCGKSLYENFHAFNLIKKIQTKHNLVFFSDFSKNPKIEDAIRGGKYFINSNCEIILAIGGGSSIDMAKLINAYQQFPNKFFKLIKGNIELKYQCKKLIAIPTTAGTGSESTHFAVVYINEKKYSLASKFLLPSIAIVDSNLVSTMSKYVAACSAFDALSQSIESYWSINSNSKSKKISLEAMRLIFKNIEKAVILKDKRSVTKLMFASNLAGRAINITKTTAPHALSYKISSLTNIAHGHAVAITLGKFFKINHYSNKIRKPITKRKNLYNMKKIYKIMKVSGPSEAENSWYKLMKICGLENDMLKLKLNTKPVVDKIVNSINIERLKNHPIKISKKEFKSIFKI